MNTKEHWEKIYLNKEDNQVSWYQENPKTSIELIKKYSINKSDKIIDIGGGNSNLTTFLLLDDFNNLFLLDISKNALERTKHKINKNIKFVNFIESNIIDFRPIDKFKVWHDRAVFHFLTNDNDIKTYKNLVKECTESNAIVIISTFSEEGPDKCSGLLVNKYDSDKILNLFKEDFNLLEQFKEVHKTPFDTTQNFLWTVLSKK